ncbi:hypothetical protein DSO57_1036933 [Entomophthora muscae]|uniref:Uncharacterized protein n=1 Tax=Entomophthora muscae TaxID=34485 RepID=A0ACC2TA44_9FUNG|nr:hypothetical protein DSO57_1036933 [Entomophthora muscae]
MGKFKDNPLVISTGFGIGIVSYLFLINEILYQHPNRTVILFETPFVNLHPTASKQETVLEVDTMFSQLNIKKCTWVGHSFGTIAAGWVVQHRPHYISKLILVDYICFRMWDTASYRALLYQTPDLLEAAMIQILFSSDSTVAYAIGRHIYWFDCLLFPEQIVMPTKFSLPPMTSSSPPLGLAPTSNIALPKTTCLTSTSPP